MSEDLKALLNSTAKEIEQVLSTKTVVGEPIVLGDSTVIPLLSVGLGFGLGGGAGKSPKDGEGTGQGVGCGLGVKPIAVIVSDKNGVRVEAIHGAATSVIEKVVETVGKGFDKARNSPTEG